MVGRNPFPVLLKQMGQLFKIERNGEIINSLKGLINRENDTKRDYVGFMPGSDVKAGDWIINPVNERFYIEETITELDRMSPLELRAFTISESKFNSRQNTPVSFHVQNAYGSVIGTQSVVNMNYNDSIKASKEHIANSNSADKAELEQIINLLEMIINNQVPLQKGIFSKFSAVMERNSWITGSISSALLGWLTTQIH